MGWKVTQSKFNEGSVLVMNQAEKNTANPRFIRIIKDVAADTLSIANEGFRRRGIKKGLRYDFSVAYRQPAAGLTVRVEMVSMAGKIIGGTTNVPVVTANEDWSKAAAGKRK